MDALSYCNIHMLTAQYVTNELSHFMAVNIYASPCLHNCKYHHGEHLVQNTCLPLYWVLTLNLQKQNGESTGVNIHVIPESLSTASRRAAPISLSPILQEAISMSPTLCNKVFLCKQAGKKMMLHDINFYHLSCREHFFPQVSFPFTLVS